MQTGVAGLVSSLAIPVHPAGLVKAQVAANESSTANESFPDEKRDYWNDWPSYFDARVSQARMERKTELTSVRGQQEVQQRISVVRSKIWEIVGGPLEKTPLNARTMGTLECKHSRIEKIVFESQPQFYVTANLYIPKAGTPPFPAILSPLGHTFGGKSAEDYQILFQNLARKGYLVLAFDPIGQGERHQYLDRKTGRPLYEPTTEHNKAGWPTLLLGSTFAQYLAWDGIRALDYLLARPEADRSRVGCVGHSGGATMTMYLCALETRIQVAIEVEGHTRNFGGLSYVPPGAIGDAEQNLVGSMKLGVDRGDMLYAFAPKPLLMAYTVNDALERPSYVQACDEIYDECRDGYRIMGAEERVRLLPSYLPHEFDSILRREAYAWLNRWLANENAGTDEIQLEALPHGALNCTNTGEVLTSLGGRSVVQVSCDRLRSLSSARSIRPESDKTPTDLVRLRDRLRLLLSLPTERVPLNGNLLSRSERPGISIEEFDFRSEKEIRVPGWFIKPSNSNAQFPTLLYVSESGKGPAVTEEIKQRELMSLARRGVAICVIGLRGYGDTSPSFPVAGPHWYYTGGGKLLLEDYAWAGLMLGNPVPGQHVWDLLCCLDFLAGRPDVDTRQIHVAGSGGGALAGLLLAVLDDRPASIICDRMLANFRSVVEAEEYDVELPCFVPGILKDFDLPELAAALAPRRLSLLNAVGVGGEVLSKSDLRANFNGAIEAYSRAGASEKLEVDILAEQPLSQTFSKWILNS